ncbi:glycosyl hydrolase family 8 [Herbiconiux moechotypicola]|uniref:Glucanase n=1 Tax=Herbiconiux moechotypicola TaxID=637393 RepID=A0ABP5QQM9_9MICO|nr:glycosyl hydrolase family 8 [Herbiconiux moechotypicola]MCS5730672.1 glycosyl hydrolase family 8 [Herbiconiux moechotypicola]
MRLRQIVTVLMTLAAVGAGTVAGAAPARAAEEPARPFGSHPVAYPSGSTTPPGGVSAADSATADAYDDWKAAYLEAGTATLCGVGRYYVDASTSTDSLVVSEGQGYGMVVVASMAGHDPAARTLFDGLYRYVLDHPSESDPGLMAWRQDETCASEPGNASAATDGDLDIAYGLLLADTQWGSVGAIDYAGEALRILTALRASAINPETLLPQLGDWTTPGDEYWYAVRSSDLMVDHFFAFQNATGDAYWGQVARASLDLIETMQAEYAPETGLLPDFIVDTDGTPAPAPAGFLESPDDGAYGWNATRVPWRLASAALLSGDERSAAAAGRIASWTIGATDAHPSRIRAGYTLGGTPLVDYGDIAFTAPLGAGAAADSAQQSWVNAVWKVLGSSPAGGYYSDSLRLQVMMLLSGNVWPPTTSAPSAVERIGGVDRFAASAALSAATFAAKTPVVFVASGEVFPDALSASAAAGAAGAPVLLVTRDTVPAAVDAELRRLAPARIVVLGGTNTISESVVSALGRRSASGTAERISGADRFAVSASVATTFFESPVDSAWVASGEVFPDALAGSAAAGAEGAPVLLTAGGSVPAPVTEALRALSPDGIRVLGGPRTVTDPTLKALGRIAPATRIGGTDRYAAAAAVSASTFSPGRVNTVYVASGEVFPDALSASAVAVADHAPVLLVTRDSVPSSTAAELDRLSPARIVVVGGPNTVAPATFTALATHLRG